jgi:hypothetical protein
MSATPAKSSLTLRPWIEVVALHPDVLSENFSEDIFALDLGPLADGNPNVPAVYRDPEHFFRVSYLTKGLRSLLTDVLSRLTGGGGNRVLKLLTPFGGGKSHTLAALYHAARSREALDVIPEAEGLPRPKKVRTAVFDGQFFDATNGKVVPGEKFRAQTVWGWVAWSLGGKAGYEMLRRQDETRVAPGADEILALLKEGPNLILLDEVLNYLISAGGVKVHDTTLRDETLAFLQRLTVAVGNTSNSAMVFSLQSSKRESLEYTNLLKMVDHLAARKDQLREPVDGNEVLSVIQRRLLARVPTAEEATPAATAYQEIVTQMRRAYANTKAEQEQAVQEGIVLRDQVRAAYPFHPALIGLMRERWAAIPDFQRTRGALRFLAAGLRATHREGKSRTVLGPGDVPIYDAEERLAFFKEIGQQADYQAVLEKDLIGANATAKRIDDRRARETPAEAGRRYASRLATAILMYSFGGLRRDGGDNTQILPPGVTEAELLAVCVGPDMDSTTAQACLKELKEQCLYLHYDGVKYCFKKDPNVTLLVEQEAEAVARDERQLTTTIKEMLEARLGGARNAIVWPEKSGDVPDREPAFLVAYLPLEFAARPKAEKERIAAELFDKYGDKPRQYRNGLGLAVPAADQVEVLRRSVRYLMAMERVKQKAKQLHLTDDQKSQLREKEQSEEGSVESAFLKLYTEVWLPKSNGAGLGVESVAVGGRQLATRLDDQKKAKVHERVMELLRDLHRRVFTSVLPTKIVGLFQLGEGEPLKLGIKTSEVVDGFYSFLGFTRLDSSAAIRKAVAKGIKEGVFGYSAGAAPTLGVEGKYQLPAARVRFGSDVAEDEVDLDSGFLMLPQAVPGEVSAPVPGPGLPFPAPGGVQPPGVPGEGAGGPGGPVVGGLPGATPVTPPGVSQKVVEISFAADRDQLYSAWPPLANLADMAGKVSVTVRAESESGFDRTKLQNGVLEPLKESNLIE